MLREKVGIVLEVETDTRAHQMLPQIPGLISIDLRARIIEKLVFNKRAELGRPIVICAGNDLPGKICVALPAARAETAAGSANVDTRGFGKVNAHSRPDVGLESVKCESRDEVPHKHATVNEASHAAPSNHKVIDC